MFDATFFNNHNVITLIQFPVGISNDRCTLYTLANTRVRYFESPESIRQKQVANLALGFSYSTVEVSGQ